MADGDPFEVPDLHQKIVGEAQRRVTWGEAMEVDRVIVWMADALQRAEQLVGRLESDRPLSLTDQIVDFIRENPGSTADEIADGVGSENVRSVRTLLGRLKGRRVISVTDIPKRTVYALRKKA